jgi:SAM-dependent methyltransferase
MLEHYARGEERDRLSTAIGQVEFTRTTELILAALPPAPATVADIGGGPGRYAIWLARLGYHVVHRDVVPLHVEQVREDAAREGITLESALGDARSIDLASGAVDAVLLLGPLYHLPLRRDRITALAEARRIVKPGGPVFASAISRWAPRLHGDVALQLRERFPIVAEQLVKVERNGVLMPLFPGSFLGYCHRPNQLRRELRAAGLERVELASVEGIAFALADLEERMADPATRAVVLEAARATGRVPELVGLGPHLLATGFRPG